MSKPLETLMKTLRDLLLLSEWRWEWECGDLCSPSNPTHLHNELKLASVEELKKWKYDRIVLSPIVVFTLLRSASISGWVDGKHNVDLDLIQLVWQEA